MRTSFIEMLTEEAERDPRIWLLTADLGFSVLEGFAARFPDRYVNVGVAEQNMIGIAAGLAHSGLRPFVYSIANFPTMRCFEQIRVDVCYHQLPVKIVAVGGGLAYGTQGYTHHGVEDLAVMRTLPGMKVVAPGDPIETRILTGAIASDNGPCYLRLGKGKEPIVHDDYPNLRLGKAWTIRDGNDVTFITCGAILANVVDAADALEQERIQARVLSMHTIKPLDEAAIVKAIRETGRIITVEEHSVTGGLGSAVADVIAHSGEAVRFEKMGIPDEPYHLIGTQPFLRQRLIGDIAAQARRLFRSCKVA